MQFGWIIAQTSFDQRNDAHIHNTLSLVISLTLLHLDAFSFLPTGRRSLKAWSKIKHKTTKRTHTYTRTPARRFTHSHTTRARRVKRVFSIVCFLVLLETFLLLSFYDIFLVLLPLGILVPDLFHICWCCFSFPTTDERNDDDTVEEEVCVCFRCFCLRRSIPPPQAFSMARSDGLIESFSTLNLNSFHRSLTHFRAVDAGFAALCDRFSLTHTRTIDQITIIQQL